MLTLPIRAPQYDGHNFADLPATIQYWLTGQGAPAFAPDVVGDFARRYDLVVLIFIDGFGWQFLERHADDYEFLRQFTRHGRLAKITSQFPSTTAAHVTCLHTGVPVGQSGVYEWQYYEPLVDAVITPLLFSYAGTMRRDTLAPTGIRPERLYPAQSLYASLAAHDVMSYSLGSREFTPSTYSKIVMRGAKILPYKSFTESLINVAELVPRVNAPTYMVLYYGNIDAISHMYGPDSVQTRAQVDLALYVLDKWFLQLTRGKRKNTLLVLTADHGHMAVTPQETRYLNADPRLRKALRWLKTDRRGVPLIPAGSARDAFLYIRDEALDEARAFLANELQDYADVVKTDDLIAQGYFGELPVSDTLRGRLGNLTILPHPHNCVWWYEKDRFEQRFFGHHGGLTPTEMEIPLGLLELSA